LLSLVDDEMAGVSWLIDWLRLTEEVVIVEAFGVQGSGGEKGWRVIQKEVGPISLRSRRGSLRLDKIRKIRQLSKISVWSNL